MGQWGLGLMYYLGQGTPQDFVLAHMWLNLAVGNVEDGYPPENIIKMRDAVAKEMTPSQIAEAQQLARTCTANNFKGC